MNLVYGFRRFITIALLIVLLAFCTVASAQPGRLDFLKAKDSSFALFANTSNTQSLTWSGPYYKNELILLTGLPSNPTISARIDLLGGTYVCAGCGGIRNVAISPDGDTALLSSEPSVTYTSTAPRAESILFLLRNLRAFAHSKDPGDLSIRRLKASEFPQLDNVAGIAFGPDGQWAVVNTYGPGNIDGDHTAVRGTVVVITGLPDHPACSSPFPVPMHSLGNIDLSLDGNTLLLNDSTDVAGGSLKANLIVLQGIRPGNSPRIAAIATLPMPPDTAPNGPPVVKSAKLTLDGKFILAPIPLIRAFDAKGVPIPRNEIAILGPLRNGRLDTARLLTEADGVHGGPYEPTVSPDGDSALVDNALDNGGANLITGLSWGDPTKIGIKPLPFPFFGPPFPLGPGGPPVLAAHGQAIFTSDGDSALTVNFLSPPLAGMPLLTPSISVLTGFRSGNIRVAANFSDRTFNPFDNSQQIATTPTGLMDYINQYLPAGTPRENLISILNEAIARADRGDPDRATVDRLVTFILATNELAKGGVLNKSQAKVLETLATAGIQVLTGQTQNGSAAGFNPGPVSADSIATLLGIGLSGSSATSGPGLAPTSLAGSSVTLIDSTGLEFAAPLFQVSPTQITYRVPALMAVGRGIALVSSNGQRVAAATVDIESVSPGLFTRPGGSLVAAALQRVRSDGNQTSETVAGPIDLGPATDEVFLVLFGTGISGRAKLSDVTVTVGGQSLPVLFAGAQGGFSGLDQVNVLLPRTLMGRGEIEIALSVDGWNANVVTVNIR
jgi:uncharacterized protein (TIGR03437 family)